MKFVYCIAKQPGPHQYIDKAKDRFHWSLCSKYKMKNRFISAHTSDDLVNFVIETCSKTHFASKFY